MVQVKQRLEKRFLKLDVFLKDKHDKAISNNTVDAGYIRKAEVIHTVYT